MNSLPSLPSLPPPSRLAIISAFAAIYVIWGSTYLAISQAVIDVPPVFMVAVRGLLAGGVLYLGCRLKGCVPVSIRELAGTVPTAILLFFGGYVLVGWAEQQVPSGSAALLNSTTPAWVVLFEWFGRKRARPDLRFAIALGLGFVGTAVLVRGAGDGSLPLLPALALIGASIAWAAGTLRTHASAQGSPVRSASVQLLTGGLLLIPVSIISGEAPRIAAGFTTNSLAALAYLVIAGSLVGYSAYVWLLHHVRASKVASHAYINPLIAVGVGALIANEQLFATTITAAFLILVSVFFIVTEPAASRTRKARVGQPSNATTCSATAA